MSTLSKSSFVSCTVHARMRLSRLVIEASLNEIDNRAKKSFFRRLWGGSDTAKLLQDVQGNIVDIRGILTVRHFSIGYPYHRLI